MNIEAIKAFAREALKDDTSGHDWKHALRVEKNARAITPSDLPASEKEVILAASFLHDTIDEKVEHKKTMAEVRQVLEENGASSTQVADILNIIKNISYANNLEEKQPLNETGQIVQDADRLDALGAIGIARAFYYGGHKGDALYDETAPRDVKDLTAANYREGTSVLNHFYEKLFQLEKQMNTTLGTAEAVRRTRFMRAFIEEFYGEITE